MKQQKYFSIKIKFLFCYISTRSFQQYSALDVQLLIILSLIECFLISPQIVCVCVHKIKEISANEEAKMQISCRYDKRPETLLTSSVWL